MLLRELVFQGLFDADVPVRLSFEKGINAVDVPSNVTHLDVQDIVASMLYESETSHRLRMEYSASDAKVALTLEHRGKIYRIIRRADAGSLRLQSEEGGSWKDMAAAEQVQPLLHRSMGLPDFSVFWSVNIWRFEDDPELETKLDLDSVDPRLRELIMKYRNAYEAEAIEDRVQSIEGRIHELEREMGQSLVLEDKLEKGRAKLREIQVQELSQEDLELLQEKEDLLEEFTMNIERLAEDEEIERAEVLETLPQPWAKSPFFIVGLLIGIACTAASISMADTPWRAAALANIIGFGGCAYALLVYFIGMEKAGVHQVRLESIKRRLSQLREEEVALQEHLNHLLIHARVDNTRELTSRVTKAAKLSVMLEKMEAEVASLRRDPKYLRAQEELESLNEELEVAKRQRTEMPGDAMSAYQLESDLQTMGIDPAAVLRDDAPEESETVEPLGRVLQAAQATGQWDGTHLHAKTAKMWKRIAGHVLGDRFREVGLDDGQLKVGDLGPEQMAMWRRTRASEERVVLASLALAIQVIAPEVSKRGFLETVLIQNPSETLTSAQANKFAEVFKSAAKRGSVVMLTEETILAI